MGSTPAFGSYIMKSRLSRRIENQSRKNLILTTLGIIVVITFLVKFGMPLLINSTLLVINAKNEDNQEQTQNKTVSFVSPPILDPTFTATNSANVTISGSAGTNQQVKLYLNGELIDTQTAKSDGRFSFTDVKIINGENTIKTKAVTKDNKISAFSNTLTIIFKNTPPTLSIDSPSEGQSFSKDDKYTSVSGKTDPGVKVTVNDLWAIVNTDGKFSYNFPLQNGENKIKITAVDGAGNKTEMEKKVTYSP